VIFVYATPTTVFYTLSLHDALPISVRRVVLAPPRGERRGCNYPAGRFVRSPSPVRCLARAALAGCAVDGSFMEKLLIIDDEADIQRSFKRLLAAPELDIHAAGSSEEALELLPTLKPDLVI